MRVVLERVLMEKQDLENRFKAYPATNENMKAAHEDVRHHCWVLAAAINELVPEGREKSLAITHLEEVMFWANAGIARNSD